MDKFNRSKFFKSETVSNTKESDLLTNTINDTLFKRESSFYTVVETDLLRPDLISYKVYSKVVYWWIIMKVNNIEDPFNDLEAGTSLVIPNVLDVEEYQMQNRRKNRN